MPDKDQHIEYEKREKKSDPSRIATTFIKYTAYIVILLIVLWFLIQYILPMFS
ncbi:hypothetical protein [Radiobacillus sp. PE A8.2]|uniref:hypothetical protein n=1 Tax=Radiobacillus sp. PE A8.2 TaxID=3380349 RepID=UPI00388F91F7